SGVLTRELYKRAADSPNHIPNRYLARVTAENVTPFGSTAAPHDVHALQNLHDLKQELHGYAVPVRNVLDANRRVTFILQGQFQHCGTGVFILGGNLHTTRKFIKLVRSTALR